VQRAIGNRPKEIWPEAHLFGDSSLQANSLTRLIARRVFVCLPNVEHSEYLPMRCQALSQKGIDYVCYGCAACA
jgi:hypothetical protein